MSSCPEIPKEHIPFKTKINYSLGSTSSGLLMNLVFANVSYYYVEKLGANAALIGIAWLLFGIWNTVNDPIASYIIDNTRTKIGRRKPYIRYGSVFYGLAFIFCWFPFAQPGDQIGLFINFFLALFLLDTMFTLVGCCYFCLPNEIALTNKGRAELSLFTSLFGIIMIGISFAVPILLLTGQNGVHPLFLPVMVIIGASCAIILFGSSFFIKENMFAQCQPYEPFLEGLKLTLKNRAFWIYMLPAFCIAIVLPILELGILYYIDYIINGQDYIIMLLVLLISVLIGFSLNLLKIEKWGAKRMTIINLSLISIGFGILFFIGYNALLAAIPCAFIGIGFAGSMLSGTVIMGDIIDNDELITGKRREGIYGGVNAIVTKYPISLANWMFLSLIVMFGFIQPILRDGVAIKQPQTQLARIGIMFAFCVVPAALLAISALFMKWYPLDGPEWKEKRRSIMDLHQKKEEEYVKSLATLGKLSQKK